MVFAGAHGGEGERGNTSEEMMELATRRREHGGAHRWLAAFEWCGEGLWQ